MKSIFCLILGSLLLSCNDRNYKLQSCQTKLSHLNSVLDSLSIENSISDSYIATAEVNQVLRSEADKQIQLQNLNDHRRTIQNQIVAVEDSIRVFSDSVYLFFR
jgi:outer membrane murein-binding lipoprotein Lpp